MKIVCLLNSKASFDRIKNEIHEQSVQWQLEPSLERIQNTLAVDFFELAIIDHSIDHFEQIVELLELKDIKMIIFRGVYDDVINDAKRKIKDFLIEEAEEEKEYIASSRPIKTNQNLNFGQEQPFKVIEREVIKTERIEVPVYQNIANSIISVINLSERAGSTFVSMNLARVLNKYNVPVTLFESPVGTIDLFYTMGIFDQDKSYYSYKENLKVHGKIEREYLPKIEGVSVGVLEPGSEEIEWKTEDTLRLLATSAGVNIVDVGFGYKNPAIDELIKISSLILVVVDPISTQIVRHNDRLEEFKELEALGYEVKYVFNRWDDSIKKKTFEDGFGLKSFITIPFLSIKNIYQMYFKSNFEFLVDHKEVGDELESCYSPLISRFVSEQEQTNRRKRKRFIFI